MLLGLSTSEAFLHQGEDAWPYIAILLAMIGANEHLTRSSHKARSTRRNESAETGSYQEADSAIGDVVKRHGRPVRRLLRDSAKSPTSYLVLLRYCPPPPATVYCPDYSDQGGNQYLAPQDSFPPETQLGPALGDIPWGQVADTLGHVLRPPRATPATPHFDPQGRRYYFDSQGRRYFLDYQGRRCYLTPQGREYFLDHQGRPYYLDPQGFRTYDFYMDRQGRVYYVDPEERVHFFETQGRPCYLDSQGRAYYRDSLGWEFGLDPHGRPYYL
ncbi:hypothetical protein KFL_008130050 [Klebsormidium nitens]|uniref:Uncharacterized protein n=1 Tax=Klebsormidium nitens TaxID=105231 RepID=A0A1Y1IQR8_KLENI|nr:hypothetical protein KFL_008130050 [Klebsormidium nitens]|eukprot:GAQ91591.1 hypothetical protein KFL_008130050 [Klebsormidium nitens]